MSCSDSRRVVCESVAKSFRLENGGSLEVLHGISLTVSASEAVALSGPNGSGKSTLLKIVAGLDTPTTGTVKVGRGCELAYLTQGIAEYAGRDLTVCEQVSLGRLSSSSWRSAGVILSSRVARARARALLAQLGMNLERRLDDYMRSLSGGQVQAVMLTAIIGEEPPDILLLDEHSAALDSSVRAKIVRRLVQLVDEQALSILFVTHEQDLITDMAARVVEVEPARVLW